jgi:murein DD-endopeptidase MepM/ murein hydrolase activator NlpD
MLTGAAAAYAVSLPNTAGSAQGAEAADGLTYSGLAAYGMPQESTSLSLRVQPLTSAVATGQSAVQSSLPASSVDAVRLAASRLATDPLTPGDPVPPAAPTASPTATPAAPTCEPAANDLYCIYTVQTGDTLSKIAKQFGLTGTAGVASWELVVQSNKPDITSADDFIQPGQKLRIPLRNGIVHLVLTGETIGELAEDYGVSVSQLTAAGNNVPASGALEIGQEILIPDPEHLPAPKPAPVVPPVIATAEATATPESEAEPQATETPAGAATPVQSPPPATATKSTAATKTPVPTSSTTPRASRAGFIWPATGPISSYFGPSHPLGIDIDLFSNPNAPIVAAAAGKVVFAGGDPCCSYGLYVIVEHANGYSTLYAHLSQINVVVGQQVTQGQLLGLGGRTGYATGNHLHFEVRINGTVIDPLSVLP